MAVSNGSIKLDKIIQTPIQGKHHAALWNKSVSASRNHFSTTLICMSALIIFMTEQLIHHFKINKIVLNVQSQDFKLEVLNGAIQTDRNILSDRDPDSDKDIDNFSMLCFIVLKNFEYTFDSYLHLPSLSFLIHRLLSYLHVKGQKNSSGPICSVWDNKYSCR